MNIIDELDTISRIGVDDEDEEAKDEKPCSEVVGIPPSERDQFKNEIDQEMVQARTYRPSETIEFYGG